jgi:hypothetical protein
MIGNLPFDNGSFENYIKYFGYLFSQIKLTRTSNNEKSGSQVLPVPIQYGPSQKFIARTEQLTDLDKRQVATKLPRMTYEVVAIDYDSSRHLNKDNNIKNVSPTNDILTQSNVVPYNIIFLLSVYVKNASDGFNILGQILPSFSPAYTRTLNIIPEMNLQLDVPVVLDNVTLRDTYEGKFDEVRYIIWSLTFTMKVHLFGPVNESNGIIKEVFVNFKANVNSPIQNLTITLLKGNFLPGDQILQSNGSLYNAYGIVNSSNALLTCVSVESGTFYSDSNIFTPNQSAIGKVTEVSQLITETEQMTIRPGLTANGLPTSDIHQTISLDEISANSDYGFIINIEDLQ